MHARDWFMVFLAILLPPLPVAVKTGCSCDLLINILLCVLGFLPGMIHAFYIIAKHPEPEAYVHLEEGSLNYGAVSD